MIAIVDYGMGNLRSVQKGLERVGFAAEVTAEANRITHADKLILPGVGAFRDAMAQLRKSDLIAPIKDFLDSGRPFLGICLGLQLLFETGLEDGEHAGLGIFPGRVERFTNRPGLKVPHMGWNELKVRRRPPLMNGLSEDASVYFVHSYHVVPADESVVATVTDYGGPFVSSVWRDNIVATQFHPEKSQKVGLAMLKAFAEQ